MKVSFNQNNLRLCPIDNEFVNDCEGCVFLYTTTSNSYTCRLIDFGTDSFERLPYCFQSIFIPKPLSDIFKL